MPRYVMQRTFPKELQMDTHTSSVLTRRLAGGLVIAAASFPAVAQAMPAADPPRSEGGQVQSAMTVAPPRFDGRASQDGFQWSDAGIGAAGAIVLLGAGAGASGALRRRRVHRTVVG